MRQHNPVCADKWIDGVPKLYPMLLRNWSKGPFITSLVCVRSGILKAGNFFCRIRDFIILRCSMIKTILSAWASGTPQGATSGPRVPSSQQRFWWGGGHFLHALPWCNLMNDTDRLVTSVRSGVGKAQWCHSHFYFLKVIYCATAVFVFNKEDVKVCPL